MVSITLIALIAVVIYIYLNYKRLFNWIKQRQHIYKCMAEIDGPNALPIIGCVHNFKLNMRGWEISQSVFGLLSDIYNLVKKFIKSK